MVELSSQQKTALSLLFGAFMLVGMAAFLDPAITGYATNEDTNPLQSSYMSFGAYSMPADFKVSLDYDLGVYQEVRQGLDDIMACANEGETVETCAERQDTAELDWQLHCQQGVERVFYDVVELLKTCAVLDDEQAACSCQRSLADMALGPGNPQQEAEFIINFEERSGEMFAVSESHPESLAESIGPAGRYTGFASSLKLIYEGGKGTEALWEHMDDKERAVSSSEFLAVNREDSGGAISLQPVGQATEEIQGVMGRRLTAQSPTLASQCQLPPDNIRRFCVTQKNTEVLAYDAIDKQTKYRPVTIRFAAHVPDEPPEALTLLAVEDRPKDERAVFLSWEESEAKDVASYQVYAATDPLLFEDQTTIELQQSSAIVSGRFSIAAQQELGGMPDLSSCAFDSQQGTCLYEVNGLPQALDEAALYFVPSQVGPGTYVLSFPLPPDEEHTLSVVAVDKGNNQLSNGEGEELPVVGPVKPEDDLPPSSEDFVALSEPSYNPDTETATVNRKSTPSQNLDGTLTQDFAGAAIYYAKDADEQPVDSWKLSRFEGPLPATDINGNAYGVDLSGTDPQPGDVYHLVVAARDEEGNPEQEQYTVAELGTRVLPPFAVPFPIQPDP